MPFYIKRGLLLALGSALILSMLSLYAIKKAESSRVLPVEYILPDFKFTEQNGNPFGLSDMKGKITVVDFFFTDCKGSCPMMSAKISELYKLYSETDKIQFISISVDPDNDSTSVLKEYANKFGVTDTRWEFIRGNADSTKALAEKGFKLSGDFPGMHSTKFVLVDELGQIRGYYNFEDEKSIKVLKADIRQLYMNFQNNQK